VRTLRAVLSRLTNLEVARPATALGAAAFLFASRAPERRVHH
jgi:hypothetical protein